MSTVQGPFIRLIFTVAHIGMMEKKMETTGIVGINVGVILGLY